MLKKGARIDQPTEAGETFLMRSVSTLKPAFVEAALKYGAKVERTNKDGYNSLHFACFVPRATAILERLLQHNYIPVNEVNCNQATPLMLAVQSNAFDHVKILLNLPNIDVRPADKNGNTILHIIASTYSNDRQKLLKLLVEKAPLLLDVPNCRNETPLLLALYHGNKAAASCLIAAGNKNVLRYKYSIGDYIRDSIGDTVAIYSSR
jgi:ankyrin repeat protein